MTRISTMDLFTVFGARWLGKLAKEAFKDF